MHQQLVRLAQILVRVGTRGAALLCLLFGLGCNPATSGLRGDLLRTSREFNEDLRWARHEQFLPRLTPEGRARYQDRLQAIGDEIEVVDTEVMNLDFIDKGERALCRVQLDWVDRRTSMVQRTVLIQTWEDRRTQGWSLSKLVRLRGAPLSFADEPPPRPAPADKPAPDKAPADKPAPDKAPADKPAG